RRRDSAPVAGLGLRSGRMPPGTPRRDRSTTEAVAATATEGTRDPRVEVVEDCTNPAKWLIRAWSNQASHVATRLDDRSYDADTAAEDFAAAVSLATESGARVAWGALDALTILTGRLDQPYLVDSDEFSTHLN